MESHGFFSIDKNQVKQVSCILKKVILSIDYVCPIMI